MTAISLLTENDFKHFKDELKNELIQAIKSLLSENYGSSELEYLKTKDVRRILKCSDSTLQYYRDSGRLLFKKIGRTYYYKREDITNLINSGNITL
jgi:hypothetical protein